MSSGGSESGHPSKSKVLSTHVFESGPPVPVNQSDVLLTTKTEELTTKKKTDTLVTKQIETRVRREIVVTEDGEILEDSGPTVTTETTEKSRTEEQENTERKTSGSDDPGPGWVLVPGSQVVSSTKKINNTSNETKEEKTDTEITEEVGGLTREEIFKAIKQKEQSALKRRDSSSVGGSSSPIPGRNLVEQTSHSHKVVDTEETDQVSEYKDGQLSTETKTKSNREEFFDEDVPEDDYEQIMNRSSSYNSPTSTTTRNKSGGGGGTSIPSHHQQQQHMDYENGSEQVLRKKREDHSRRQEKERRETVATKKSDDPNEEEEVTRKYKTFNWVNNHFGSQDFDETGLTGGTQRVTVSLPRTKVSNDIVSEGVAGQSRNVPVTIDSDDSSQRRVHYTKRQQMPSGKPKKYPAPPPPPSSSSSAMPPEKPPRSHSKGTGNHRNESPKRQYYLGEDPGVGSRFVGTITTDSLRRTSKPQYETPKYATLGRDSRQDGTRFERRFDVVDTSATPSVTDIIHSLRSKAFLEKESAAVSVRDDDSVFDHYSRSNLYRPIIHSSNERPLAAASAAPKTKQHVIKISIKSDDSDCSSTVNSPRNGGGTPTHNRSFEFQNTSTRNGNGNDSIVKNAINNLLKNRMNGSDSSNPVSPNNSAYGSLSRNRARNTMGSNLKSTKTYLTVSTPNVNKIELKEPVIYKEYVVPRQLNSNFNGSRSRSIGNLNGGHRAYDYERQNYGTSSSGVTRLDVNGSIPTKRSQFMQRMVENKNDYYKSERDEDLPIHRRTTTTTYRCRPTTTSPMSWSQSKDSPSRTYSPSSIGSPPSSPSYSNRIKLPSPVPPSRLSSSPPPSSSSSPRSPLPPLTRPYSPPTSYYNNNSRSRYDNHITTDYDYAPSSKTLPNRAKTSPRLFPSRSPSPPPFVRRPPSPVLPKPSSLGDDDGSNSSSGRSRSTNPGSRIGSDISHPNERIETNNRKKVTTTLVKRREVELPENDYYYDAISNDSLGRNKSRSVIRLNNWNGR